jgi:hypothetical protein
MSTDAILDLTAAAVVFGSFVVGTNWDTIRSAMLRMHDAGPRFGATIRPLSKS